MSKYLDTTPFGRPRSAAVFSMNSIAIFGCLLLAVCDNCGTRRAGDWEFQYEVKNPGTRSESVVGKLLYKGQVLPKELRHVVTPIGEFSFVEKNVLWDHSGIPPGWLPSFVRSDGRLWYAQTEGEIKDLFSGKNPAFRSTALKDRAPAGSSEASITAKLEARPANAGGDWFYAVDQSLWINPAKIDAFMKTPTEKPSPR